MAIIECPECGKDVSSKAQSCPHCGCPLWNESVSYVLQTGNATSNSNFSMFLKVLAVLSWIGGLVLAIMTGKTYSVSRYGNVISEFSFVSFITILLPFVIDGAILWGIGNVVDKIECTNSIITGISLKKQVVRQQTPKGNSSMPRTSSPAQRLDGNWKCPNCGTENSALSLYCKACGEYR